MPNVDRHPHGTFCWLDLAAHDREAAKRFYTALFGWTANDLKYGEGENDVYTMYLYQGRDAAASYAMDDAQRSQGYPPAWLAYVAVDDADEATRRARELGAAVLADPFDVMDVGRMGLIADPTGATLGLWQASSHVGVTIHGEPGTVCWFELATRDTGRASDFYTALFGWTGDTQDYGMPYTTFSGGGQPVGGMYGITEEMGDLPTAWVPYFAVADADEAAARAEELGASVEMPARDIPGVGRIVMIRDPQGAHLYLIRLEMPENS